MSMTHDEMIAVIQAHKEGKEVEWRPTGAERWRLATPLWDFDTCEYRIKPEPKTIWVNEYDDDGYIYNNEQNAKRSAAGHALRVAVEYQEVVK